MARPLRIEYPGALYHITSRGNSRRNIYKDNQDRDIFFNVLAQIVNRYRFICYAYCLMDNHYHLLIETQDANLSLGMRQLNGVYTQRFNRRHKTVGHVYQGRFKAILVQKDSYLLELCRYIVLNPVRAGIVKDPQEWIWSSYLATIAKTPALPWLSRDWILNQFDSSYRKAVKKYRAFVLDGIEKKSPWNLLRGQIYLGSEEFCQSFTQEEPIPEIPREQFQPIRLSLTQIMTHKSQWKEQAAKAYCKYGYRLKEIANHLEIHYATVSRWIQEVERNV